jgi:anti-sigma B factor antagonist
MRLEHQLIEGISVVVVHAKELGVANSAAFREAVEPHVDQNTKIVLDLAPVEFVDSSGLGAILSVLRKVSTGEGDLRVCGACPQVQSLFEMVRLDRILQIFATRDEAIASFR